MTDSERIVALESRIAQLEMRIAEIERGVVYQPKHYPSPNIPQIPPIIDWPIGYPYKITCEAI